MLFKRKSGVVWRGPLNVIWYSCGILDWSKRALAESLNQSLISLCCYSIEMSGLISLWCYLKLQTAWYQTWDFLCCCITSSLGLLQDPTPLLLLTWHSGLFQDWNLSLMVSLCLCDEVSGGQWLKPLADLQKTSLLNLVVIASHLLTQWYSLRPVFSSFFDPLWQ